MPCVRTALAWLFVVVAGLPALAQDKKEKTRALNVDLGFVNASGNAGSFDDQSTRRGLQGFQGVEHRIETVATIRNVTYVNDSKATNLASMQSARLPARSTRNFQAKLARKQSSPSSIDRFPGYTPSAQSLL